MSLRAAALVVALVGLGGQAAADPIHFEPLGLYCGFVDEVGVLSCDETTPIMWPPGADGALTMVEHHSNFRVRSQVRMHLLCFTHPAARLGSCIFALVFASPTALNPLWRTLHPKQ